MVSVDYDALIPQTTDPETGLPIGPKLPRPGPAKLPERTTLEGHYCRLEPLDSKRHGGQLYRASTPPNAAALHRYLPDRAPASEQAYDDWLTRASASDDPLYFAVVDKQSGQAEGRQTLMRITPSHQCIEIGNIYWGPNIARTPVTTEANFLFARYVFEQLGYRRYEWKCDALNAPSRNAARRFGFRYEGHFRRAVIIRGRSRDTAWFSIIDEDWPALKSAYECWLAPSNFDAQGRQRLRLSELTAALER